MSNAEIILLILVAILMVAVSALAGIAAGLYANRQALTAMMRTAYRREHRLNQQIQILTNKNDSLTDSIITRAGYQPLRPVPKDTPSGTNWKPKGRIFRSPSEAIARHKEQQPGSGDTTPTTPSNEDLAFIQEVQNLKAGESNVPRNGSTGS